MDDHFLPQTYLRGFTDPNEPAGKRARVWYHDALTRRWTLRNPKGFASIPNLYHYTGEGGSSAGDIEVGLSVIEGQFAEVLKRKIEPGNALDASDREKIAAFVALMLIRVPATLDRQGDVVVKVASKVIYNICNAVQRDPTALDKIKAFLRGSDVDHLLADLRPEHFDASQLTIRPGKKVMLAVLSALPDVTAAVSAMGWVFVRAIPPDYFITSDNPCISWNDASRMGWTEHGLLFDDTELTLPLTRSLALFGQWQYCGLSVVPAPRLLVEEVNIRTARRASKFLVSAKRTFPGVEVILG